MTDLPIRQSFRGRRWLHLSAKVGLVLSGLLVGLAMAELVARWLGPPFGGLPFPLECDRLVGWRGIPHLSLPVNTDGYQHQVNFNSRGMHDQERQFNKEAGVFRILMLGDSFVEALQVEEDETSHHLLEEILNASASPTVQFEVMSAGAGGWGPAQELMYFRSEGQLYAPDLVLLLWFPANDLQDNLPEHRRTGWSGINCYAPYFAICKGQFDPEPWFSAPGIPPTWQQCTAAKKPITQALNHLYHSSRLYQRLDPFLSKKERWLDYDSYYLPWTDQDRTDKVLNYAYQLNADIYTQLADEARQIGAKTAVVIVPLREVLRSETDSHFKVMLETSVELSQANPALPNQIFSELMAARQIPILDLQPPFVTHLRERKGLLYATGEDFHWNITGNQKAAELIAEWLVEQALIPQ